MAGLAHWGKVLVVAPHPDDEILGCGGTMARLVEEGADLSVIVATRGKPPAFPVDQVETIQREMREAHAIIGVSNTRVLDLPAAALDTVPAAELNATIGAAIADIQPDTLLLPFVGDIHGDHQLTFLAAMVAARPRHDRAPSRIMAYETLSETNWYAAPTTPAFVPDCFVDISSTLETKLAAFRAFASQVRDFPEERSIEALEALARLRGSTVHLRAAESFRSIRIIER